MITLNITDEQLQEALEQSLVKIFAADNYSNPLKQIAEKAIGNSYSKGTLTEQIEAKIVTKLNQFMETTEFDAMLGAAVAKAIADREVSKTKK